MRGILVYREGVWYVVGTLWGYDWPCIAVDTMRVQRGISWLTHLHVV